MNSSLLSRQYLIEFNSVFDHCSIPNYISFRLIFCFLCHYNPLLQVHSICYLISCLPPCHKTFPILLHPKTPGKTNDWRTFKQSYPILKISSDMSCCNVNVFSTPQMILNYQNILYLFWPNISHQSNVTLSKHLLT